MFFSPGGIALNSPMNAGQKGGVAPLTSERAQLKLLFWPCKTAEGGNMPSGIVTNTNYW